MKQNEWVWVTVVFFLVFVRFQSLRLRAADRLVLVTCASKITDFWKKICKDLLSTFFNRESQGKIPTLISYSLKKDMNASWE